LSRSDPAAARFSGYAFPDELVVDELLLRAPVDSDIDAIAPAFLDPEVAARRGCPRSTPRRYA
jgi:hypothetical protein